MCNIFLFIFAYFYSTNEFYISARNALLVLICAGIAALLLSYDIEVLTLTQRVKPGLPPFAFPVFSYTYFNNITNQTIHKDFIHIVQVCLYIIELENVSIYKLFCNLIINLKLQTELIWQHNG